MIKSFKDEETKKIFNGNKSLKLDQSMQSVARRKLRMVDAAKVLEDLKIPPGNHLENLQGKLEGFCSIRINDQYRIIFEWNEGAENVQIKDYH